MRSYTAKESLLETINYFGGDSLPADAWLRKYCLKDNGTYFEETPDDMHWRLAKEFARVDAKLSPNNPIQASVFHDAMKNFKRIVPQGSPMYGIGNKYNLASISNCFVVPGPVDSIEGIFNTARDMAQIMKRRGGVGVDISNLRPENMKVNNAANKSSGAWSFADFFSYVGRMIGQCVDSETRVLTKEHGYITIKELVDNRIKCHAWTHKGWKPVTNWYNNGEKECVTIKTKTGLTITCTDDHEFSVIEEQNGKSVLTKKKLNEISDTHIHSLLSNSSTDCNYQLLKKPDYPYMHGHENDYYDYDIPEILNEDLAYFVGFYFGDGSNEYHKQASPVNVSSISIAGHTEENYINDNVENLVSSLFGVQTKFKSTVGKSCRLRFGRRRLFFVLQENNLLKEKSDNIRVPQLIWQSPVSVKMAFIAGLLDSDGKIANKDKVYKTCSDQMANDLMLLLYECGISCNKSQYNQKVGNHIWEIRITGTLSHTILLEDCPSIKVKKDGYVVRSDFRMTPFRNTDLCIKKSKDHKYVPHSPQYMSRSTLHKYSKQYNDKNLELLSNLGRDEIISIEKAGKREVYDIEVDDTHMYMANGLYISNCGRQGAIMITMHIKHPDARQFALMKSNLQKVTGANISLKITDEFMEAVENDTTFIQQWPIDSEEPTIKQEIKARDLWDLIVDCAQKSGEPGLLMWDNITKNLPAELYPGFKSVCVNPCAELLLSSFDSCRLISINLTGYVTAPFNGSSFDWDLFKKDIRLAMRMSDDLVELEIEAIQAILDNGFPEDESGHSDERALWEKIQAVAIKGRRTGLGTHGLADCLAMLRIRYDSDEALEMVDKIYGTLKEIAYDESVEMAKERGVFPASRDVVVNEDECEFIKRLSPSLRDKMKTYGRRNISLLTNAPTGSVSCLSQTSSGIEPIFRLAYNRRVKLTWDDLPLSVDHIDANGDKWHEYEIEHHAFKAWKEHEGIKECDDLPDFFVTSDKIDPEIRVKMQGIIQSHIDHGISSTLNLPHESTMDDVNNIYFKAWKYGLKGVTVYVEGSRDGVLLSKSQTTQQKAPKRPKELPCRIHRTTHRGIDWAVIVSFLDDQPYEVFAGKLEDLSIPVWLDEAVVRKIRSRTYAIVYTVDINGSDVEAIVPIKESFTEDDGMLVRLLMNSLLRHRAPIETLYDVVIKSTDITTFARVVMRVLKEYIDLDSSGYVLKCSECKSPLVMEEGCFRCSACGVSLCS